MKIAYDIRQMRPGCVLLQAAMGGDPFCAKQFDSETWLVFPTPDLHVYEVSDKQLQELIRRTKKP